MQEVSTLIIAALLITLALAAVTGFCLVAILVLAIWGGEYRDLLDLLWRLAATTVLSGAIFLGLAKLCEEI